MVVELPLAMMLLAQATTAAPPAAAGPTQAAPSANTTPKANECSPPQPNAQVIVICTQRPQGYRLNPDIMEAKRETHSAGRPVRPGGTVRPDCATVGPVPCVTAGINLVAAALTAVEMAQRVAKGQEVGTMFKTDPQPDEYHLYLMAKARREAEEAQEAATAKAKAAAASTPAAAEPAPSTSGN